MDIKDELLSWAASNPKCYEYSFVCVFCGAEEYQEHTANCLHIRAKAFVNNELPKVAYCPTCGTPLGIVEDSTTTI